MRRLTRALILLTLLLPQVALAQTAAPPAPATQATTPIQTTSTQQTDAAIRSRLTGILDVLGGYGGVKVEVAEGVVTLTGEVLTPQDQTALTDLSNRIDGVIAVRNNTQQTTSLERRLVPAFDHFKDRLAQLAAGLPLLLIAGLAFAAIVWLGLRIARLERPWRRIAPNAFLADILRQVLRLVFGLVGLVVALDILGASALLGTILGAAGILGIALGFAVKDTVENFIASIMLSLRQPFAPNDQIEINGDTGTVVRLTSRATILLSPDGNHIRIPNATVFTSRIVNYTQNPQRRFDFPIGVSRGDDLDAARALAERTVAALPFVLGTPAPAVWIDALDAGGVTLQVTGWIDQRQSALPLAKGEALRQVKRALEGAGVTIPDNVQPIAISRAAAPGTGTAAEPGHVAPVRPTQQQAVDALATTERNRDDAPDLLRDDAPQE